MQELSPLHPCVLAAGLGLLLTRSGDNRRAQSKVCRSSGVHASDLRAKPRNWRSQDISETHSQLQKLLQNQHLKHSEVLFLGAPVVQHSDLGPSPAVTDATSHGTGRTGSKKKLLGAGTLLSQQPPRLQTSPRGIPQATGCRASL